MVLALIVFLPVLGLTQQSGTSDSARLHQLFAQDWEYTMREYPEFATAVGYPGQNARWTDNPLTALRAIDRAKLSPTDQLNYDLFRRNYTDALEESRFAGEFMPINQMGGVQQDVPSTIAQMPAGTVREYEDIVARLRA